MSHPAPRASGAPHPADDFSLATLLVLGTCCGLLFAYTGWAQIGDTWVSVGPLEHMPGVSPRIARTCASLVAVWAGVMRTVDGQRLGEHLSRTYWVPASLVAGFGFGYGVVVLAVTDSSVILTLVFALLLAIGGTCIAGSARRQPGAP